jgi:triacylglycerol esterase/lipase EstA (alpha/beta hydrolase family)
VPGGHHVLLVPGFFGFATLGEFAYFAHVRDYLVEIGPQVGLRGQVEVVNTVPTASLRKRAALLVEAIAKLLDASAGEADVSIVGHSSGGLDARLAVSPEVTLPTSADVERCASRVRAIVSVSAPHAGTPVAHFFNSLLGQQLLRVLSVATMYSLRAGRLPLGAVFKLTRILRRPDAPPAGVVEQIYRQLLADFSAERRRALEEFFGHLGKDQDLLAQITPAGIDPFDAATQDRPGVRYGCVTTMARPPGLRSFLGAGVDPYAQATHALYVALYRIAATTPPERAYRGGLARVHALSRAFGSRVDARSNDGMVPTLSQLHGEVVHAAFADHHDVIGHFHHPTHVPPQFDWLTSGTGFTRAMFEATWRDVARFIAAAGSDR